jgi:hypothetical protein
MQLTTGDIWDVFGKDNKIVVVTTNQTKCSYGLVMGAGCAKEAKERIPELPKLMSWYTDLKSPYHFALFEDLGVACLQTKVDWKDPSPVELVEDSLKYLNLYAKTMKDTEFHCPLPGCGKGGLDWTTQVWSLCKPLPDNCVFYGTKELVATAAKEEEEMIPF